MARYVPITHTHTNTYTYTCTHTDVYMYIYRNCNLEYGQFVALFLETRLQQFGQFLNDL